LYRTLGYVDEGAESPRFEGRAKTAPGSGVRPMRAADFPAVQALDAEAQGGPRVALLEALLSASTRAVVLEERGAITAFGLATHLEEFLVLAPIVAREDAAARAIASALAHDAAEPIRLDLEPGERALHAWAEEAGLAPAGTSPRMIKDGRALPGRRSLVRAMAGRAYG
jgi:hypothetical protein